MCDSLTLSLIKEVAEQKVRNKELFTAFDVTLASQACLKKKGIFDYTCHRHQHLKDDVHKVVESHVASGEYSRNLQDVGAPSKAFVYFPAGGDPSTYVPLTRTDSPAPVSNDPYTINVPGVGQAHAVASVVPTNTPDSNTGDGLDYGRTPDARGCLTVPANLLRAAGFQHNDSAFVVSGQDAAGKPQLTVTKDSSLNHRAVYTVDIDCRVRITKSVLDYAGFASQTYDFVGDSDKVYVKAA